MKKRLLSALLALVMVVGLLPAAVLPVPAAAAAGAGGNAAAGAAAAASESPDKAAQVTYTAMNDRIANMDSNTKAYRPEVAILNQYTGNSVKFYESIRKDSNIAWRYNALRLFGGWDFSATAPVNGTWSWSGEPLTSYDTDAKKNWYGSLGNMGIAGLMEKSNNLEIGLSATLTNAHHTHDMSKYRISSISYEIARLFLTGEQILYISGADTSEIYNSIQSNVGEMQYKPISGYNKTTANDNNPGNDMYLEFSGNGGYYVKGNYYDCGTCGAKAENIIVTFRDTKAPKFSNIEYSTDGRNFSPYWKNTTRVKEGQTLYIRISFDESIRFADDSAEGMEELYVELLCSGDTTGSNRKAYLYEVGVNDLYFKYTISGKDRYEVISTISTDALFAAVGADKTNNSIPLVQIGGIPAGTFTVSTPMDAASDYGFNKSKCYITDIAGNPWEEKTLAGANLVIDTGTAYVDEVTFGAGTNNAELKAFLNKQPGTTDYSDTSDLYLGVGDTLSMTIKMNERLKLNLKKVQSTNNEGELRMYPRLNWDYAYATTNIIAPTGYEGHTTTIDGTQYVDVCTAYMTPYAYNDKSGDPTVFLMQSLPITEGMTVDTSRPGNNTNGEIKVIAFHFDFKNDTDYLAQLNAADAACLAADGSVMDLAGNVLDNDNVKVKLPVEVKDDNGTITGYEGPDANQNPYRLDVIAPTVTGGTYTPLDSAATGTKAGFSYSFTLGYGAGEAVSTSGIGVNCSEYLGCFGSFILTSADGANYPYQYAVKAAGESTVSDSDWKDATTGVSVRFTQTQDVILYVRPLADTTTLNGENKTYDLHGCTLIVSAQDFAGNVNTVTLPQGESTAFAWYIDTTPPTITGGETSRVLEGTTGKLTAQVNLSDSNGIFKWEYGWTNSSEAAPTTWIAGGDISNNTAKSITVSTVPNESNGGTVTAGTENSLFSKYLWVRATDNSDNKNEKTECLGLYTYDLRKASYDLTYVSNSVTQKADVKVSSLGTDDTLIFVIPTKGIMPGSTSDSDNLVLAVNGSQITSETNIFNMAGWKWYSGGGKNEDGIYQFNNWGGDDETGDAIISQYFTDDTSEYQYHGTLTVKVLSGKTAHVNTNVNNTGCITAGDEQYQFSENEFTLKLTSVNPEYNYVYEVSRDTTLITLTGPDFLRSTIRDQYTGGDGKDYWYSAVAGGSAVALPSTLEGVELTITIPHDNNGWVCEDIDWAESKIILTNHTDGTTYEVNIRPFTVNKSGTGNLAVQTVTLPAAGVAGGNHGATYTTGTYSAKLELHFVGSTKTLDVEYKNWDPSGLSAWTHIAVDATEAKSDFSITSIGYGADSLYGDYNYFGMNDPEIYGEDQSFTPNQRDGVIYIPVAGGDLFESRKWYYGSYAINITSPGEAAPVQISYPSGNTFAWTGLYAVRMWNQSNPDHKVYLRPGDNPEVADNTQPIFGSYTPPGFIVGADSEAAAAEAKEKNLINLTADADNVIVLEKIYSNGKTCTTTVKIHPVTQHLSGKLSIDSSTNELVFTPDDKDAAMSMSDPKVYAFAYDAATMSYPQGTQDYTKGEGTLIRMSMNADGTWRCPLEENGATYRVFTINDSGSVWSANDAFVHERAPWIRDDEYAKPKITDHGDGTYTLTFEVYDDYGSIVTNSTNSGEIRWPDITISIGNDDSVQSFRLNMEEFVKDSTVGGTGKYTWSTGNRFSPTGIYAVEVSPAYYNWNAGSLDNKFNFTDYLKVTVHAVALQSRPNEITISVKDAIGNTGGKTITLDAESAPQYVAPAILTNELARSDHEAKSLKLTFNQPVLPTESWAWTMEGSKKTVSSTTNETTVTTVEYDGFGTTWIGDFPITANGTYDVTVRDVTGAVRVIESVPITAFTVDGKNWGMQIDWSETALTTDPVTITAKFVESPSDVAGMWIKLLKDGRETLMIPEGSYNGTETEESAAGWDINSGRFYQSHLGWSEYNLDATSNPRTVKVTENGAIQIEVYDKRYSDFRGNSSASRVYTQLVYVDNIVNGAPSATLTYRVEETGSYFTYAELVEYVGTGRELEGNVTVSYTTSRTVFPLDGTGSTFIFTPENYAETGSHEFRYEDEVGNKGSVTAQLPAGLTLKPPTTPKADETPPTVKVHVYQKVSGSYSSAETFSVTDQSLPADLFTKLGITQGYRLLLDVTDESGYTVSVTAADGVTLDGNMVNITKPATFTVTVTDKSTAGNSTQFTITEAMLGAIDATPPAVVGVPEVTSSLYQKIITIELRDDRGGSVTLLSPEGATALGNNKYQYVVTKNGDVKFVFEDEVGNIGEYTVSVTGVDVDPPTLTVMWTPALSKDRPDAPTDKLVNTDIIAVVSSNKAIYDLTMTVNDDAPVTLLTGGKATSSNPYEHGAFTVTAYPERIVVKFHQSYSGKILLSATAPNGETKAIELNTNGWLNIDKNRPYITPYFTPLYRQKPDGTNYGVAYAVMVSLYPDEQVTSDYGENITSTDPVTGEKVTTPVIYGFDKSTNTDNPLELIYTEKGSYQVRFTDLAGNVTNTKFEIPANIDIDRTAPVITLGEVQHGTGGTATVEIKVNENCTVTVNGRSYDLTADVPKTVTFTNNGSFLVTAVDLAGNESTDAVVVGIVDMIAPSISFVNNTIFLMQDSTAAELNAELNKGYTLWDNASESSNLTVTISNPVNLSVAKVYTVVYTVKDEAGNTSTANRFVQVVGKNTVCVEIDGKLVMPGSMTVITPGEAHTFRLRNCNEPYTIKARYGNLAIGQMKYLTESSLSFDADGRFTVDSNGYYTLLVTTQSRQTIRILLYAE